MLKIPHSIQALQDHVRLEHPALLDYCAIGWEALPDRLKMDWLQGLPSYSGGCRRVYLVAFDRPGTWTSWVEFAGESLRRETSPHEWRTDLIVEKSNDG